jgi:hypothetical protein
MPIPPPQSSSNSYANASSSSQTSNGLVQTKPNVAVAPIPSQMSYPAAVANLVPICSVPSMSTGSTINGTMNSSLCPSLLSNSLTNALLTLKRPTPMPICTNPLAAGNASLIGPPMIPMNPNNAAAVAAAAHAFNHQQSGILTASSMVRPSPSTSLCTSPTQSRDQTMMTQSLLSPSASDRPDRPGSATDGSQANSPLCLTPILLDSEIQKLAETATRIASSIPPVEPKLQAGKRKISKELEVWVRFCFSCFS